MGLVSALPQSCERATKLSASCSHLQSECSVHCADIKGWRGVQRVRHKALCIRTTLLIRKPSCIFRLFKTFPAFWFAKKFWSLPKNARTHIENSVAFTQLPVECPALLTALGMWSRCHLSHDLTSQEWPTYVGYVVFSWLTCK